MVMTGTSGNDTLFGGLLGDLLEGLDGNDHLYGDAANDTLDGGGGNDFLDGGAGSNTLVGAYGNDSLIGGGDNDRLSGGAGDDSLDGASGVLDAAFYSGIIGDYRLDRNLDSLMLLDARDYTTSGTTRTLDLEGSDTLSGVERIVLGSQWYDLIFMQSTTPLVGISANEIIFGSAGNDSIDGGDGDDYINGVSGDDTLRGGAWQRYDPCW